MFAGEVKTSFNRARTMTIYVITFSELLRAYRRVPDLTFPCMQRMRGVCSCRSMRQSVFTLGLFSNKWMQYAVGVAVAGTIVVGNTPG